MWDGNIVKGNLSDKIFSTIMQFKDNKIYKWIYRHPHISIITLAGIAVFILYYFISFILNNVINI